jgi:hypothetical protein
LFAPYFRKVVAYTVRGLITVELNEFGNALEMINGNHKGVDPLIVPDLCFSLFAASLSLEIFRTALGGYLRFLKSAIDQVMWKASAGARIATLIR